MDITASLQPGDCLLYKPASVFGSVIAIKTWHSVAHVEIYIGDGESVASRDGKGVDRYPLRTAQLGWILRPTAPLDWRAGMFYAFKKFGTPYGWLDLLNFVGVNVHTRGIICSAFATEFYRACGWNIFPTDEAADIAPFEFLNLVGNGFSIV